MTAAIKVAVAGARWSAWGLSGLAALVFLTHPVGVPAQVALSLSALAGMALLWVLAPRRGLARTGFVALGSLVVIRYVYWRVTETLPETGDPVGLGIGLLLLGAELYCVVILGLSLTINADPLERRAREAGADADLPGVDILIPTYNEGTEILAATVAAARGLDYPAEKLTVWLLDDGGTDEKCADADPAKAARARGRRSELQALCAELGARYVTRARNEHAKAGNLNAGLAASKAEIVVVLDADHAPFRPFLRETIGHFAADPKLFLVQTPHVFLNPDPIERNLRTFERMPSENEMFYGVTQRGLDKWNGSFFCGSAALLRRAALDAVGGFSGVTITEDCETALELHARGWTSAYVDTPLIAGLQPETLADFIGQRARWCQGMFQILILKNPLLKPGLKPIQRLSYLSSMSFWFFPLPRLAFMLAPLLHIFFDVKIFVASIDEALAFTATYVVANMMLQNYLYGHVRWPWISELYEYVQGVYLARSIASVVVSPRRPSFNVTAKGVGLDRDHLSPLAWPFVAIFGLLACGVATAAWRYAYEPGVTSLMIVVGLWCLFNLVVAGAALGVVAERAQPERYPSLPVDRSGTLHVEGAAHAVAIERMSIAGCTLRLRDGVAPPIGAACLLAGIAVDGATLDPVAVTITETRVAGAVAVDFAAPAPRDYRAIADLMYGDAAAVARFVGRRRRSTNLAAGTLRLFGWSLTEPVRAARYALAAMRAKAIVAPAAEEGLAPTTVAAAPAAVAVAPVAMPAVEAATVAGPVRSEPVAIEPVGLARGPSAAAWIEGLQALSGHEIRDIEAELAAEGASPATGTDGWMDWLLESARAEGLDVGADAAAALPSRRAA